MHIRVDDVADVLKGLERELIDPGVRKNEARLLELLAEEFREFGSSGRVYTRRQIIEALKVEQPGELELTDFEAQPLADECIHVTYRTSRIDDGSVKLASVRSSIWIRRASRWQMVFHQGTRTGDVMVKTQDKERRTAYVLLRATMGINFLGHGTIRLLHGNTAFAQGMVKQLTGTPLPHGFVFVFGWALPFLEFVVGALLVAGVATRLAVVAGALLIMALMVGVTLNQDWNTAGGQLLYALIFAVLLFYRAEYDTGWMSLMRRGSAG